MRYATFYNKTTLKDTLMIIYSSSLQPTKVISKNDVTVLYNNDQLIGINIFHFSKYYKFKGFKGSYIPNMSKKLFDTINIILKNEKLDEIKYQADSGIKVAKIIDIESHPDSNHLNICKVDIGEKEPLQIVCGAYNVKKDLKVICATLYSYLPSGRQIVPSKIMNVESFGMLCSAKELMLKGLENKRGLHILDDKSKVGDDFFVKCKY